VIFNKAKVQSSLNHATISLFASDVLIWHQQLGQFANSHKSFPIVLEVVPSNV
jgi:hypothetical protein